MKKVLFLLSLMMVTMTMMAVPAKRGLWKTLKLSDGTEVRAQLVGDEHGHFWKSADGKAYQESGEFYKVIDANALIKKANARRSEVNASRVQRLSKAKSRRAGQTSAYTGKKRGIIILVNFDGTTFKSGHDNALYQNIANGENYKEGKFKGSMSDYFKAQSQGKFELDFDVVGPVTVSKKSSYYGKNDSDGNDMYAGEMVIEAVNLAMEEITDWTPYDWDSDGEVDQVYVVYAGKGEADGGSATTIWPHAYSLSSAKSYGDGTGPVTVGTNLKVNVYACGPELDGQSTNQEVSGIGTMCHEFSHCLGYPDFYDTDYSGGWGMCSWDLMDSGSYNGNGYQPAGYTSWERWEAGWQEPIVLDEEDVTVENMQSLQSGGDFYIMYNKKNKNEYFLLENRKLDGWDASLPGSGLLILHVDYKASVWQNNTPNDDPSHQRMTWVPADKKYQYMIYNGEKYYDVAGIENDPFPYNTTNSFNKDFGDMAKLYNKNTDGSYFLNNSVEEITRNADGTISFKYVAEYGGSSSTGGDPVPPTDDYLFYESFNKCNGTGGNDGKWNLNIASSTFKPDHEEWTACTDNAGAEKAYGANQCAKFGGGGITGWATTPTFAINGTGKLTFKAGAWNANSDGTTLKLSVSEGTISPESVTMVKGDFTDFEATVTATGDVMITFASEIGRFFLDEVLVVDPTTTAIQNIPVRNTQEGRIYTLDGRFVGTDINMLNRGLYIVNGRKVAIK